MGMLIIAGVLMGASFITTAIIFAHYDLAAVQLGAEAQAEAYELFSVLKPSLGGGGVLL